jgi:RNA polymerase sigma-70 factor (ECF subfamily)
MTNLDDNGLVQRTLEGDRNAFGVLVERYQAQVFTIAWRMLGVREEAEDVAQSVFLKAYEKLGTFDPRYKFFSWIYRIAHNESVNAIERRSRVQGLDEGLEVAAAGVENPDLPQLVEKCLAKLDVGHRSVLVLKYVQDLPYEEIGVILGIPAKTVKSRLFSARAVLRQIMSREGLSDND